MKKAISIGAGLLFCGLVLGAGGGCAVDAGTEDESVGSQTQALTTQVYFDATAKVQIEVKTCDWSEVSERPVTFCSVDSGYVLVGGGAEVEGSASGGGLLTHSYPISTFTWQAASKDHVAAYAHRIRAYAVGMKLNGMSSGTLRSLVTIGRATSGVSNRPTASVSVPGGNVMLSGGAFVTYNGPGMLLTESYPSDDFTWTASGKDHAQADSGSITTAVISVPVCLNNLWTSGECLITDVRSNSVFGGGYTLATASTPSGFAPLGVGGRARWSGPGRLLTDIFPTNSIGNAGATVFSKDHLFAESNITDVWAISAQSFL